MNNDSSSSGFIKPLSFNNDNVFTEHQEILCRGFNKIYKAKRFNKWYILKGLKPEYASQGIYIELLNKEFDLGIQLDNPHIIKIIGKEYDSIVGNCIVMEYIDGITLTEFIKQNNSKITYRKIINELINGLAYLHSKQIIHRDLKPDNILITHNGNNVKIIDFGLSDTDYYAILKQPAGTPKYTAPEQLQDGITIDCRADIYALGLIIIQMFQKQAKAELANKLPVPYNNIAIKCTQKKPEHRYQNVSEIVYDLEKQKIPLTKIIIGILFVFLIISIVLMIQNNKTTTPEDPKTLLGETEDKQISNTPINKPEITTDNPTRKENLPNNKENNIGENIKADKKEKSEITVISNPTIELEPIIMKKDDEKSNEKTVEKIEKKTIGKTNMPHIDTLINIYENIFQDVFLYYVDRPRDNSSFRKITKKECDIALNDLKNKFPKDIKILSELDNYSPYIYTNLTEKYKDTIQYIYRDHIYKEQMLKLRYDAIEIAVKNIANIPITQKEQDYIKSYPWEVKIGKQAYTKLEPMFKNIIPKLKKAKTLTKQIEIILEHTKNVFKIQAELQKNLKNDSVHICQLGFYKANSILNKNTFKDNIFVFEYYDNSVFLTVNESNYKESELYRQITDIEREKFNIKLRRTPNMAVHFLLYLIPHKQRWQFF